MRSMRSMVLGFAVLSSFAGVSEAQAPTAEQSDFEIMVNECVARINEATLDVVKQRTANACAVSFAEKFGGRAHSKWILYVDDVEASENRAVVHLANPTSKLVLFLERNRGEPDFDAVVNEIVNVNMKKGQKLMV